MAAVSAAQAKAALRSDIRAARRRRDPDERERAGHRLADGALLLVERLRTAGRSVCRVAAYRSTPSEPATERLLARLSTAGIEVVLPVTEPDRTLAWELAGTRLAPDALATVDLVLAPGLAADRTGMRLGQGGGYYDAALRWVRPGIPVVVVLYDDEVRDEPVPAEPHDRRVDAALTPGRGTVWFTGG